MRVCILKKYRVMLVFLSILALSLLVLSVLWLLLAAILPEYSPFTPIGFFWLWWFVDAIGYGIAIATLIIAGGLIGKYVKTRTPLSIYELKSSMITTATAVISSALLIIFLVAEILGLSTLSLIAIIALCFALVPAIISWLFTPAIINAVYSARYSPQLQEIVNEVAKNAGIKPPKAVIVPAPYPNAFAYSSPIYGSYVAVTEGLLRRMTRDELKAVIGHELGHHKHRDMHLMLLLGIVPTFIYYLGRFLLFSGIASGGRRNERGGSALLLAVGIGVIVASILMELGVLAFSRLREFFADAHGAKVTSPWTMISALKKIHEYYSYSLRSREYIEHSKIKTLFIYAFTEPFIDLSEVLVTHPSIHKRIRFLQSVTDFSNV